MNDEIAYTPEELARLEAERQAREGEDAQAETEKQEAVDGSVAG